MVHPIGSNILPIGYSLFPILQPGAARSSIVRDVLASAQVLRGTVLQQLLNLTDAEVEAASRQIRGEDPRMRILTTLGEADGSLVDFAKNVRRALEK